MCSSSISQVTTDTYQLSSTTTSIIFISRYLILVYAHNLFNPYITKSIHVRKAIKET